ncbi:MAG TPA: YdeI/OmpD-associated family protein [Flavipsychrobacter sp.]|jgi:hypothetical protein|nr:YdeI/OmpD-associated family protein [Flavipsychrobacter sp.]
MQLLKKLNFKEGSSIDVVLPFKPLPNWLNHFPVTYNLNPTQQASEQVIVVIKDSTQFELILPPYLKQLPEKIDLWIAFPKKSSSLYTDLGRDACAKLMEAHHWDAVTNIAHDQDWTALRFKRIKDTAKRQNATASFASEFIDFAARKVSLPDDVIDLLKDYPELLVVFQRLSFTHQKEYIAAIEEAKKPETRVRRIEKMMTQLQVLQNKKIKKDYAII